MRANRKSGWDKRIILSKLLVCVFAFSMFFSAALPKQKVYAASMNRTLTLSTVQKAALANCTAYKKVLNKIDMQDIKYAAAVKSIQMKKKNMSTFRWTPLLSFKFPEQPTLANEYEWQYKPLQIQCMISKLNHQLADEKAACTETVSNLYVDAYICQEKIAFYEESLENAKDTLKRNQAKLITGEAAQADVTKMEQSISGLTTSLTLQMRSFESIKKRLGQYIKLDITSGYVFENPFLDADIPRSALDGLTEHTLENDQSFYETKMDRQLAYSSLTMTESLMKKKYGGNLNSILPYIEAAKKGEEVDSYEFKQVYNKMLELIDQPWVGTKKILFIKINKEWFKGSVDGSRYVEDDPYALYTAALEYADAYREEEQQRIELTNTVSDSFESLINARSSYKQAADSCAELDLEVKKKQELNRLGRLPYEELAELQEEYRQEQLSALELLAEYSKLLYSFDRLTCGGITTYLSGADISMSAADGGNSYLAEELSGTAYYYITSKIEDSIFVFGISIPEEFSLEITDYELYVDGVLIETKTAADKAMIHLALDLEQVESVKVYLYNGNEIVDICEIDSGVNQAELNITGGYTVETAETSEKAVADYVYHVNKNTGLVTLTIQKRETELIAYYQILDKEQNPVMGDGLTAVGEAFTYLELLVGDFDGLKVRFYDAGKTELYTGSFSQIDSSIVIKE